MTQEQKYSNAESQAEDVEEPSWDQLIAGMTRTGSSKKH